MTASKLKCPENTSVTTAGKFGVQSGSQVRTQIVVDVCFPPDASIDAAPQHLLLWAHCRHRSGCSIRATGLPRDHHGRPLPDTRHEVAMLRLRRIAAIRCYCAILKCANYRYAGVFSHWCRKPYRALKVLGSRSIRFRRGHL